MIKAIVIDLDGVYYKKGGLWHFSEWMQSTLNMSEDEVHLLLKHAGLFDRAKLGLISESELWDNFEKELPAGIMFDRKQAVYEMAAKFQKDEELIDYLFELKTHYGLLLGICSNLESSSVTSRKIHGIEPEGFDFKIYSFEVGLAKPDREIFELVISRAGCSAEELIYIDDQENKLPQAIELGIVTHVYKDFADCKEFIEGMLTASS